MPIIKSAIKRVKQAKKKTEQNKHYKTRMLTFYKKISKLASAWDSKSVELLIPEAFSAIDMAAKKWIIHKNNAARKKARISRLAIWDVKTDKSSKKEETKKELETKVSEKLIKKDIASSW